MLSTISYGVEYSLTHLGSAVVAMSPPNFLCTPRLLIGGVRSREALTLCKHCSGVTKTSLIYQHVFSTSPKHSPILANMKKIDLTIPAKLITLYFLKIFSVDACNKIHSLSFKENQLGHTKRCFCGSRNNTGRAVIW